MAYGKLGLLWVELVATDTFHSTVLQADLRKLEKGSIYQGPSAPVLPEDGEHWYSTITKKTHWWDQSLEEWVPIASGVEFDSHTSTGTLDHPDGSVTDPKIGNRTVSDTTSIGSNTGTLTALLNGIVTQLKAVTGEANWRAAPDTTLTLAAAHIAAVAPHSGHETPAGAQTKVDTHKTGERHTLSQPIDVYGNGTLISVAPRRGVNFVNPTDIDDNAGENRVDVTFPLKGTTASSFFMNATADAGASTDYAAKDHVHNIHSPTVILEMDMNFQVPGDGTFVPMGDNATHGHYTEHHDTHAFHGTNERVTIPVGCAGRYLITASCFFQDVKAVDAGFTLINGGRYMEVRSNLGLFMIERRGANPGDERGTYLRCMEQVFMDEGDWVEIWVAQDSGFSMYCMAEGATKSALRLIKIA